jgi:hypothetical protein
MCAVELWSTKGRKMNVSKAPDSARAELWRTARLEIAQRLYQALVTQDPDQVIILCDGAGKVLARHNLWPEPSAPEIALQ